MTITPLKAALNHLELHFGLRDALRRLQFHDIVIDGKTYEEGYDALFHFELKDLAECNRFTREHHDATQRVLTPLWRYADGHRYPREYHDSLQREFGMVVHHLTVEPYSRRAVMHFYDPNTNIHPCLTSLQFTIREDIKLDVFATFRSWEMSEWAIFDLHLILAIVNKLRGHLMPEPKLGVLSVHTASAHVVLPDQAVIQ